MSSRNRTTFMFRDGAELKTEICNWEVVRVQASGFSYLYGAYAGKTEDARLEMLTMMLLKTCPLGDETESISK